jgi:predicted outer membrane protein
MVEPCVHPPEVPRPAGTAEPQRAAPHKENIMKKSTYLAGALALGLILPTAGLGISLIAASTANAQNVGSGQTGGSVAFVRDSGNAGQFEVQSGRLALERSQHVGVRGYAGQSIKDADEMINRVKFINNANVGAAMPEGLNADQQALLVRLTGLSGSDFDREYMRSQIGWRASQEDLHRLWRQWRIADHAGLRGEGRHRLRRTDPAGPRDRRFAVTALHDNGTAGGA